MSAFLPAKLHIIYDPRKLFMTPARFMEEISRWIDENHDNKVDEKCDDSGKGIKKGRFQIALESASIIYGR